MYNFLSAFSGRLKGNRVKIPNDPVTVNAEQAVDTIVLQNETGRQAWRRKSGHLRKWNDVDLLRHVPHLRQDHTVLF